MNAVCYDRLTSTQAVRCAQKAVIGLTVGYARVG
jgi:hypothetical protein